MILAGDIGGTNTRLAVFETGEERLKPLVMGVFPSREYNGLDEIVRKFMEVHHFPVEGACFGVAGPVKHGRSETPNLAWVLDERRLVSRLGLKTVKLINDLEANAYGIAGLEEKDFAVLNEGTPDEDGNMALIAAGTGLGQAGLQLRREAPAGRLYQPFPSEGGHADFAPRNELEVELLLYLLKQYEHVSYERVLSGPGLYNIYTFMHDTAGHNDEHAWLSEQKMSQGDPSSIISRAALEGSCGPCAQTIDMFVSIYGAEAGNLALKFMATGGVFLGGGIAPKIITKLQDPIFMNAFVAKGRMRSLLEAIPVRVILNDKTALLGAAHVAARSVSTT